MTKAGLPEALIAQLREQGYSDEVIKELWKWYDSPEKKGIAGY